MSFRTPFWHFFANFLFHFVFFYPQIFYQNQGVSLIAHNGFFLVSFFCSLLPPWKFLFLFLAFFVDFMGFFLVSFWFLFFFSNKKTSPLVLSLDKVSIAFWVPFFCFSSVFLWTSSLPFYPLLPKLIRKIMPKESAEKHRIETFPYIILFLLRNFNKILHYIIEIHTTSVISEFISLIIQASPSALLIA